MLGKLPHRTLQSLSDKYGPIMSLRLGQVPAVVISSPEAMELFLKTNDAVFASRPKIQASEFFFYGSRGLAFSEYGPYWRNMRKLCTLHLLSVSKVESFEPLRREEVGVAVKTLERATAAREGLKRAIKKTSKAFDSVLEKIIEEHEEAIIMNSNTEKEREDFVDILLSLMHHSVDGQNYGIDRTNIKAILIDMIGGSLETSASTILWALSELLRHPQVMKTLQDELDTVIGTNQMVVKESDLSKLSYLEMVIKETLRLHPAGALVPRESTEDVNVTLDGNGYFIKKNTRVLINLWALGRDPKVWPNAEMFCPERFNNVTNKDRDFRGVECFEFIPFGSGRRGCPGMHLGLTTVKTVSAQLVHKFNWELPWGLSPNDLDMNERYGLSLPRAKNLYAMPTCRK
ncbi:cytochrome P450 CYP736A12-like [Senna tora]|uniref:Cytochrome P450 CYP736A12-like n=1 Tax=Senna tora TaxID=362788 RepID=A0A834WGD2_9FABA|nr:cytochrome P450 CYP736A12-like [Senna tora]